MNEWDALAELQRLHRLYVSRTGKRFADRPFRARDVPGWVYFPESDRVVPLEFADVSGPPPAKPRPGARRR